MWRDADGNNEDADEYSDNDEDEATTSQRERRLEDRSKTSRSAHPSSSRLLLQLLALLGKGSEILWCCHGGTDVGRRYDSTELLLSMKMGWLMQSWSFSRGLGATLLYRAMVATASQRLRARMLIAEKGKMVQRVVHCSRWSGVHSGRVAGNLK